jgi:hypothetical protein
MHWETKVEQGGKVWLHCSRPAGSVEVGHGTAIWNTSPFYA